MNRKTLVAGALAALAGTHASADIFAWAAAVSGDWSDHSMWNGPALQTPDSILDDALIGGGNFEVALDQNVAVGSLFVSGGAGVLAGNHSLFVDGNVGISGIGSSISVGDTPALRDFDADEVSVHEGILAMYSGTAQIDDSLTITGSGGVLGVGVIEMNGSGDLTLDQGVLWAAGGQGSAESLVVRRTGSSSARLDWTSPDCHVTVWDGNTVSIEIPYTGALGGEINVSGSNGEARFVSDDAFVAAGSSEMSFYGGNLFSPSIIEASGLDSYGHVDVNGYGVLEAPLLALRGTGEIDSTSRLDLSSDVVILDSFVMNADGPGASIRSSVGGQTFNVVGGNTSINLGEGGTFDLDGGGNREINIASDSELAISAELLDVFTSEFNGTMNVDGSFRANEVQGAGYWTNAGVVNLDGGELFGRGIHNEGLIRGHGDVWCGLDNQGEVVADGGTLFLHSVDLDGTETPEAGVLRAKTGDIVLTSDINGAQHFTGSLYIGDGIGVREVFEMDLPFFTLTSDGQTGSVEMNSGRFRADRISLSGDFSTQGVSRLIVPTNDGVDRISFGSQGTHSISGTLEVDGETWTVPGATFLGNGEIYADSSVKRTFMQEGSDLDGVSFRTRGELYLWSLFADGRASMANLTLEDTSTLVATIEGFNAQGESDRYLVSGQVSIAGDLKLDLRVGFADPTPGETYTIIEAGSVVGTFDEVDLSEVSPNFRAEVLYEADRVDVFVTCKADINGDGVVSGTDYGAWLDAFNNNLPVADQNGDGVVDPTDFGAWLTNFNSGCGSL